MGSDEAFEWLGMAWADRWLTTIGASPDTLSAVHRLAVVDDLRTVDLATEAARNGLLRTFLLHALLARGDSVDLTPFADGVPLGRLAGVGVYCSDLHRQWATHSQWAAKAHGPGCQHHNQLRASDDLITLADWVRRTAAATTDPHHAPQTPLCGRCRGFSIRRLDTDELRYWSAAHEVYQAGRTISTYEQATDTGQPVSADEAQERHLLTKVAGVLDWYVRHPDLAGYAKDLRRRLKALPDRPDVRQ